MGQSRKDIAAWVGSYVLPHEAAVRAWLKRWTGRHQDIDDVIQEAYCRLAAMEDIAHVGNGRAYLFQTTRNIVLEQVRRSKIVHIDNVTDIGTLTIVDEAPPMDRVVTGARELQRVEQLTEGLPLKCRRGRRRPHRRLGIAVWRHRESPVTYAASIRYYDHVCQAS